MILLKTAKSSANLWCKTANKRGGGGRLRQSCGSTSGSRKIRPCIDYVRVRAINPQSTSKHELCRVRVNDASSRALASRTPKSLRRPRRVFQVFYLLDRSRQHWSRDHLRNLLAGLEFDNGVAQVRHQ